MKRIEKGKLFFIVKKSTLQLVISFPNTHKGDPPGNVIVRGIKVILLIRNFPNILLILP